MSFSLKANRELNNASWLIAGKVVQMLLSLMVGVWTARYLGPDGYGTISYANSYISFFMSFCTLGINSVIIKEFTDCPDQVGEILGSSIGLRVISSAFSALFIVGTVSVVDSSEPVTIVVTALCSISLVFHAVDTFMYWFQYQYMSRITALATLIAYIGISVYRLALLASGQGIVWFALASSLDYIVLGGVYVLAYRRHNGPALRFVWKTGKRILKKSYHYIFSGMMVAIYGQTDKLMLKQMLDETNVGYYSAAMAVCSMWVFVLGAVIDAMYPTILRLYKESYELYERKNRQLYAIVFYLSMIVSIGFLLVGDFVIQLLYGEQYNPAAPVLKIITWYTAFSYLGVARNAWIVCENKQKYLKYIYLGAALMNVCLNYLMIPLWGPSGAAMASLITQMFTSIGLPIITKPLRANAKIMLQAIILKDVFDKKHEEC